MKHSKPLINASTYSRRDFIKTATTAAASGMILGSRGFAADVHSSGKLHWSFANVDRMTVDGPHRFLSIAGRTGFQPTSLRTRATIRTNLHRGPEGSMSFWFSPLEDADFYSIRTRLRETVPNSTVFPLVSDTHPPRTAEQMAFGVYWSGGYPQLIGRFATGHMWSRLDYDLGPFIYAERLPLRSGCWYHVVLTWNKPRKQLRLYINGSRVGYSDSADGFAEPGDTLHIGNPAMVVSDLVFEDRVEDASAIRAQYAASRPAGNGPADEDIRVAVELIERPPLDIRRDASWKESYASDFSRQADVNQWIFQTGDDHRDDFEIRATAEGLLARTPDIIARETRMYLWSPKSFEGDQWIECDFRAEAPDGLSLLVACCRGPQREDYPLDLEMENTGSMATILGGTLNYHWEFFRRVEIMRRDVETQYLAKNPWSWRMHYGCIPRLEEGRWHRLRFVKVGGRMHGSINDRTVFDVTDAPSSNNGPNLNFGRIGLRQMYKTTMRYRNMLVYEKKPEVVTA